ncbi:hypothetical protein FPHYL_9346 [Fusarium phyllophilum]|uniref:Uncharacterized protein n=1 Tax=Fusarium phyllophilum TaxID=47803 RepID=A0A8H5N2Y0_9HYPO|nr:hypothetical protein FPHYL_9346 [Fusarium phyllophilum]
MKTTFTTTHTMVQLPPMDARITPPPEELNIAIPKLHTCPILPPSPQSLPDTPHPDTPSVCSSSSRRRRRRSSSSKSRPTPESVNQQPYANSYLMAQYCAVDAQLHNLVGDNGRRKLRKQLALLKSKANQAAEQEKAIFSRLGELFVEIRSRETWAKTWTVESPSVASSVCFSPVSYGVTTPLTPLSGTSEHFAPMGYFGDVHQAYEPPYIHQEPTPYGLETVDEAAEDIFGPDSSCDSAESETTPATPTDVVAPPFVQEKDYGSELGEELSEERFIALRERRLSLPCLHNAWPEV